jgi:hypothetical protein
VHAESGRHFRHRIALRLHCSPECFEIAVQRTESEAIRLILAYGLVVYRQELPLEKAYSDPFLRFSGDELCQDSFINEHWNHSDQVS